MKISVITITCRENPRLAEMARTIAASILRTSGATFEWIIVDEKCRSLAQIVAEPHVTTAGDSGQLSLRLIPPLPSTYRADGVDKAPAHNSARMAGVLFALDEFGLLQTLAPAAEVMRSAEPADYILMLNDCNVVTYGWAQVAIDCAKQGVGWRCKMHEVHDMPIPADGIVRHKDHHDLLRPVPPTTVAGACWGAPAQAFRDTGGFDLIYDGERKGNDVDLIIRMSRLGVRFVSTDRAFSIQLRRTKIASEVSTKKEAYAGARNQALLNNLMRDTHRTQPIHAAGKEPVVDAPVAAAPVEPEAPKPRWKKRAAPVVGGRRPPPTKRSGSTPPGPARAAGNAAPVKPRPFEVKDTTTSDNNVVSFAPPQNGANDHLGDDELDELSDIGGYE